MRRSVRGMSATAARVARRATRAAVSGRTSARRSRAGRGGIRWDRVARILLLFVLIAVLASYVGPAAKYFEAWRLSGKTRAEVQELRKDNTRLRHEAKRLRNADQIELEARRIGMARPGERVYVVRGLPRR